MALNPPYGSVDQTKCSCFADTHERPRGTVENESMHAQGDSQGGAIGQGGGGLARGALARGGPWPGGGLAKGGGAWPVEA